MIGNFYTHIKDSNVSEVRRLLNTKAINLTGAVGINALVIAANNCQEKVFAELLKYPVNIYEKIKSNGVTILHILVSHLIFATLHPNETSKFCNMIRILLNAEAERRIKNPQDCRPFLEQISKSSGSTPLQLVRSEVCRDARNKITTIISEIETRYPEIVNLKARTETMTNEHKLIANAPVTVPSPTLVHRRRMSSSENEPLLPQQMSEATEPAQNNNIWSAFWNKLFSLVSDNRSITDCESSAAKSK